MVSRSQRVQERAEACRAEAAALVRVVAEPIAPFEKIKVCIARSAQRLGWTYGRTQDVWRKEARTIHAYEMDQLREIAAARAAIKSPSWRLENPSGAEGKATRKLAS